jgi:hypothetical protein
MSRPAERWITPLVLLMLTVGYVYVLRDVFVTHRFMLTHDSVANFAPCQFAFAGCATTRFLCAAPRRDQEDRPRLLPRRALQAGHLLPLRRS